MRRTAWTALLAVVMIILLSLAYAQEETQSQQINEGEEDAAEEDWENFDDWQNLDSEGLSSCLENTQCSENIEIENVPPEAFTQENIQQVPYNRINELSQDQLTHEGVIEGMNEKQLGSLTAEQLSNPQVLVNINNADGLRNLDTNAFREGLNELSVEGVEVSHIEEGALSNINIKDENGMVYIVDANGNMVSVNYGGQGRGSMTIDQNGVIHFKNADRIDIRDEQNNLVTFSGSGTTNEDGDFMCEEAGCSAQSSMPDLTVVSASGQEVTMGGDGVKSVSFNEQGQITGMHGNLEGDYNNLQFAGQEGVYTVNSGPSTEISYNQDTGFSDVSAADSFSASYYEGGLPEGEARGADAELTIQGGGHVDSMQGTSNVDVPQCMGSCIYNNGDSSQMGGMNLEGGVLQIGAGENGAFTFEGSETNANAQIYGQETELAFFDAGNNPLAGARNSGGGNTNVLIGGEYEGTHDELVEEHGNVEYGEGEQPANLVMITASEGQEAPNAVTGYNVVNDDIEITTGSDRVNLVTGGGMASSSMTLVGTPGEESSEVNVGLWDNIPAQPGEPVAEMELNGVNLGATVRGTRGEEVDIDYPRTEDMDGPFILRTTSLDGASGEELYSNGRNQVLTEVEIDPDTGEVTERTLLTPRGFFRNSLNDNTEDEVLQVLDDAGLGNEEIADLQTKDGEDFFDVVQQAEIMDYGGEGFKPEAEEEGPAETTETTGEIPEERKDQAAAEDMAHPDERIDAISGTDPNRVRPGTINGELLTDNENANNLITQMGYDSVEDFQQAAGIQIDGQIGRQTSAAILNRCYNPEVNCHTEADDLGAFEEYVLNPVTAAVNEANENPDAAEVRAADPRFSDSNPPLPRRGGVTTTSPETQVNIPEDSSSVIINGDGGATTYTRCEDEWGIGGCGSADREIVNQDQINSELNSGDQHIVLSEEPGESYILCDGGWNSGYTCGSGGSAPAETPAPEPATTEEPAPMINPETDYIITGDLQTNIENDEVPEGCEISSRRVPDAGGEIKVLVCS